MVKKFDVHGWTYDRSSVDRLIAEVSRKSHVDGRDRQRATEFFRGLETHESDSDPAVKLEKALRRSGGKAFGLALCGNTFGRLAVPEWFAPDWSSEFQFYEYDMKKLEDWLCRNPYQVIRSSHPEEDWIDPRSGVYESTVCWREEQVRPKLEEMQKRGEWAIVQSWTNGIGFVVDIGFSELLERPVARIAHGNISRTGGGREYTSATWDHESHVGIYEADGEFTGRPIVPLPWKEYRSIASDLVGSLVGFLRSRGINFGVQFELVIHPDRPETYWLVQLRPSPAAVRGPRKRPDIRGEILTTTGKVSGAGVAEGEVAPMRFWLRERPDPCGKIVVWDHAEHNTTRGSVNHLIRAWEAGARGQIVSCWMMNNSGHGTYGRLGGEERQKYDEFCWQGLSLATPFEFDLYASLGLYEIARGGKVQLRLVSDGLVGQVYRI